MLFRWFSYVKTTVKGSGVLKSSEVLGLLGLLGPGSWVDSRRGKGDKGGKPGGVSVLGFSV